MAEQGRCVSFQDKLRTLAEDRVMTVEELLREATFDSICPGICTNAGCDYSTEYEPDQRMLAVCNGCGSHYEAAYTFCEDNGGTRVDLVFSGTPVSLVAKLMSPLSFIFNGMMRKCLEKDMAALGKVIEGDLQVQPA